MPAKINREPNRDIIDTKYAIRNVVTGAWRNGANSLRQVLTQLTDEEVVMWYDPMRGWEHVPDSITNRVVSGAYGKARAARA